MSISLKSKLFYKFVRTRMKKYVNNEQEYIKNRCPGQQFNFGETRKSNYKAPKGYVLEKGMNKHLNYEFLKLEEN